WGGPSPESDLAAREGRALIAAPMEETVFAPRRGRLLRIPGASRDGAEGDHRGCSPSPHSRTGRSNSEQPGLVEGTLPECLGSSGEYRLPPRQEASTRYTSRDPRGPPEEARGV